jgi:hypothetical protein
LRTGKNAAAVYECGHHENGQADLRPVSSAITYSGLTLILELLDEGLGSAKTFVVNVLGLLAEMRHLAAGYATAKQPVPKSLACSNPRAIGRVAKHGEYK